MNKLGVFLWNLFSATMIFLYHMVPNYAIAEEEPAPTSYVNNNDKKMTSKYFTSIQEVANANAEKRTVQLCQTGEYLEGCGVTIVGTNWLKGMSKPVDIKTPDYYSYNTADEDTINMENLRKFFNRTESITYVSKTASSAASGGYTYTDITVSPEEYKKYLYQILSNFCTNSQGYLTDIHCKKCPNKAHIEPSTVEEDTIKTGKLLWDSWNVHTIADCYMNKFTDSTGTYIYVAENVEDTTTGANCYYSTEKLGSYLYYK